MFIKRLVAQNLCQMLLEFGLEGKETCDCCVVVPAFNPSTREAEAGGSLYVRGQPGLQSECQDSQSCTEKPCLEKPKKPKTNKQNQKSKCLSQGRLG